MLKQGDEAIIGRISSIVAHIWEDEKIPGNWNKAQIIPVHKKVINIMKM